MDITLQQIMPFPLASMLHGRESIWGNQIVLKAGHKVLLNAASGKGKSTFTNLIYGIRSDFSGKLLFDKQDTQSFSPNQWIEIRRKQISVVFQDLQLFPSLTVRENLLLKNNLCSLFNEQEIIEMLGLLEIDNKWDQTCGLLSMGQQQRVAIVRALLQPFKWLILDEPFSHLDAANTQRALKLLLARCESLQAGFVLTSLGDRHDFVFDTEIKL